MLTLKSVHCCKQDTVRDLLIDWIDSKTSTTMRTRFSQYLVVLAREPTSFWRENVAAVVILQPVSARMSKWRKQISNVKSFIILRSGECVSSFSKESSQNSANVLVVVLVLESKGLYSLDRGGGALPMITYTGRLRPKEVLFSGFQVRTWKGSKGFHELKYIKGREFCRFGLWNDRKRLTDSLYDCKRVAKTFWFCGFLEGVIGPGLTVRQPSNGLKLNRQPSKKVIFIVNRQNTG